MSFGDFLQRLGDFVSRPLTSWGGENRHPPFAFTNSLQHQIAMGEEAQSGRNWSRVAALYAKSVDENDLKSASGAACTEILRAVDETLPFDQATFIVDMGCGNGQVISRLFDSSKHAAQIPDGARLVAADVSQNFTDMVKERKNQRSKQSQLWQRLEVQRWDARDLSNEAKEGEVSHLLASFAYFAMPGEQEALAEAYRIIKPGGIFVETSMGWTEWGELPQIIKQLRPEKRIPGPQTHWQSVEGVMKTLAAVGFQDVSAREFEVTMPLDSYEDALEFVFEGFPFMRGLVADMSEDEVRQLRELMLQRVKERHPEEPFRLTGRGYVGYGRK